MKLSEDLQARGLIKDTTFDSPTWLDTPRTFYLGADCNSADSLTIGNLAVYLLAKRLMNAGWKAVLLVGGATSLIGDPGGKDEERALKSREEIARNVAGIKAQVSQLFEGAEFTLVDNYDWFKDIGYLEFLRDVGKHFSMTELTQRDFIASRMGEGGSGISYAEFSYSLIQGYDYWHLYKTQHVELQIGGSDQWGNMLSGAPLIRKREGSEVHALSCPLVINQATGKKFGKSEAGAVWLSAVRTTPTQFYQFWINCDDNGIEDYLKVYTMLHVDDIEQLVATHRQDPAKRLAQQTLAQAVTTLVHGDEATVIAQHITEFLTGQRPVAEATDQELTALRAEIPFVSARLEVPLSELLVSAKLAASTSEARRLLAGNAVSLNGRKTTDEALSAGDFTNGRLLLRRGKKFRDSALIELQAS